MCHILSHRARFFFFFKRKRLLRLRIDVRFIRVAKLRDRLFYDREICKFGKIAEIGISKTVPQCDLFCDRRIDGIFITSN